MKRSAGNQPVISKFGNVFVEWDGVALDRVLAQLRREREWHGIEIESSSSEAEHNALLAHAEQIKDNATLYHDTTEMLS